MTKTKGLSTPSTRARDGPSKMNRTGTRNARLRRLEILDLSVATVGLFQFETWSHFGVADGAARVAGEGQHSGAAERPGDEHERQQSAPTAGQALVDEQRGDGHAAERDAERSRGLGLLL